MREASLNSLTLAFRSARSKVSLYSRMRAISMPWWKMGFSTPSTPLRCASAMRESFPVSHASSQSRENPGNLCFQA